MLVVCFFELILDYNFEGLPGLRDGISNDVNREGTGWCFLAEGLRIDVKGEVAVQEVDIVDQPAGEAGLLVRPYIPEADLLYPRQITATRSASLLVHNSHRPLLCPAPQGIRIGRALSRL